MFRSPKLQRITDLVTTYQTLHPNATVDEMVDDPAILAAIDDYEPASKRSRERAKNIVRRCMALDVDADGVRRWVNLDQPKLIQDDPADPPIVVTEPGYQPAPLALVAADAVRAAAIRKVFKSIRTRLRNMPWMTPAIFTECDVFFDNIMRKLGA